MPFSRTEPNVPAYAEDPNSPFETTQQTSITVSLASPSDRVLILEDPQKQGYNSLQVNGSTGQEYFLRLNDGTSVTNKTEFNLGSSGERSKIELLGRSGRIGMSVGDATSAGQRVGGQNLAVGGPINQFRFFDRFGNSRDARFRVFTLDV